MDVGELLAFKPTTAPKRPAPKDEKVGFKIYFKIRFVTK